ncbi:hypothetical protein F4815DRAFT_452326 [Daldinia loculata]|uniref:uncharacterized protein n=1 Tax=Daldinia loculata TaxID=103429 RepID=UPI0020C2ACB3|nr:uncharacterized protein F4817DRAFT_341424 [Daldinia loculata]KAI1646168.1 hypothetical protein F4817DRAFT_341424 [Daldinia loculata]KAI2785331.1 hypothetical protein F4815DRAFT_452326 [Daldinia loculata]
MGFDALSRLKSARVATEEYLKEKWEHRKSRSSSEIEEDVAKAEEERRRREKNEFLNLVLAKITGESAIEMPLLQWDPIASRRAVFLITTLIEFGRFELSKNTYKLLAKHVGMSQHSVSHWALCVIDRSFNPSYCYDLMSDQMALNAIGKSYFRVAEITPEFIQTWSSCYYIGETTKSHEEIQRIGANHMSVHPRYNLLTSNCQDMAESLVRELCDGRIISQAKLSEELSLVSPKIALDLMVARLRSKIEVLDEHEDSDTVKADMDTIKGLWHKVHR